MKAISRPYLCVRQETQIPNFEAEEMWATFARNIVDYVLLWAECVPTDEPARAEKVFQRAWNRLSQDLPKKKLAETAKVVPMTEIAGYAGKILEGQVKGRIVVDVHK